MHEANQPSWDPRVETVVRSVRDAIQETATSSLVGLYLYGSLIAGDFDPEVSDIDLIAVLPADPDDELIGALEAMHEALAREHAAWNDRIDVVYVGKSHLRECQRRVSRMAVISPGEPLHVVSGGPEWLLTWYPARQEALALIGSPITSLIPEIGEGAFLDQVRARLKAFGSAIGDDESRGSCAYAILTVCRGLYTLDTGTRPSKRQAAAWAAMSFPQWKGLIESSLAWRREQWVRPTRDRAAVRDARSFVDDMMVRLER